MVLLVISCSFRVYVIWLVVWNIFYFFHSIGNAIIPTDALIRFRGVGLNHQAVMISSVHLMDHPTGDTAPAGQVPEAEMKGPA